MTTLDLSPAPGAAPLPKMVLAQAGAEVRAILRNGEQLLLTLIIPVLLLVGFSKAPFLDVEGPRASTSWRPACWRWRCCRRRSPARPSRPASSGATAC